MSSFLCRTALSGSLVFSLLLTASLPALAQDVPGSADAGRVQRDITRTLPAARQEEPLKIERATPFDAPAGAEKIKFVLRNVIVDGASVYSKSQIESMYASSVGQEISLADVYALAANLTTRYRNDGYILTQVVVPPQSIEAGVVRLRVVEGRLDQIRVEGAGAQGSNGTIIRMYTDELKQGGVLNNKNLERALLLINDLPGVSARSVLSPSQTKTGMSDLTVIVDRDLFEGVAGLSNYGSRFLGMWQATGSLYANSLLGLNERLSLDLAYSPSGQGIDSELLYGNLRGEVPVGPWGTRVAAFYGVTNTVPGHTLETLDVKGFSKSGGVEVIHPVIRTRDFSFSTTAGLDVRSTHTKSNIPTDTTDDLTMMRLSGHVNFVDTLFAAAVTDATVGVHKGVSWFGASEKGDADLSRLDADPDAFKATFDATRLERLFGSFALQTSVGGQWSNAPLLTAEEFGLGGATGFGRGYDPSELVGDDGLAGSVELQWTQADPAPRIDSYTLYGFYDIGKVWNQDATSSALKQQSLASAGVGAKATIVNDVKANVMIAVPLTRDVEAENDSDPRLYAGFSYNF